MSSNRLLQAHLATQRIAHTYLVTGPQGPEKDELVKGFAKALNCEGKTGKVPGTNPVPGTFSGDRCGCASCGKIERGTHPDVQWFAADKKSGAVKIEEVRARLHQASLRPYEGKWKVFIIGQAENLTLESAHTLLKTLEEPPEHSVFLLLVEHKSHLLETLQSRGVEIRVPPGPQPDPREDEKIRVLESGGWDAFFEGIRNQPRAELEETLRNLLLWLLQRSVSEWKKDAARSKRYLEALEAVYETEKALDENANPKLAVTHLELCVGKLLNV